MSTISTSRLFSLPAELQTHVLLCLPARHIARVRQVCRELRDFVDTNAKHLSDLIHKRECDRLQKFINHNIAYDDSVGFLEAFSRWARLRGWAAWSLFNNINICDIESIHGFVTHWATVKCLSGTAEQLTWCTFSIKVAYDYCHRPQDQSKASSYRWAKSSQKFVHHMISDHHNPLGLKPEDYEDMYAELSDGTHECLSGPWHPGAKRLMDDFPSLLVSHLSWYDTPPPLPRLVLTPGFCPQEAVVKRLRTPKLPNSGLFAYHVKTEWALKLAKRAVEEETALEPIENDAVMEELLIY